MSSIIFVKECEFSCSLSSNCHSERQPSTLSHQQALSNECNHYLKSRKNSQQVTIAAVSGNSAFIIFQR